MPSAASGAVVATFLSATHTYYTPTLFANPSRQGKRRTHHGRDTLYDDQNDTGQGKEARKHDGQADGAADARHLERRGHGHGPEHGRELLVGEREGPEAEVRGRVRDAVEAELWVQSFVFSNPLVTPHPPESIS